MFQPCLRTSYLYWQFINFLNFIRYVHFVGFFIILLINNMHSEEMYYYHTFLFLIWLAKGPIRLFLSWIAKMPGRYHVTFYAFCSLRRCVRGSILRGTGLQMFGAAMSFIANVLIALPLSLSLMFATSLRVTGKCSSSQKTQFLSHRKSIILKKNAFIDKRILISVLLNRVSRDTYTYVDLLNLNRIRSSIIKSISIMKLFWTLSDKPPPFLDSI